ncbi:unnamed protein product [Calypogeia fissa]
MPAEDPEKRFERAMSRLFATTRSSASCPATPATSSAGVSSPVRDTNAVSSAAAAFAAFREQRRSPVVQQTPSPNSRPQCRPWDRGDLLRRLATFKSMTWFGKPEVAGPVACARRGWINVDVDLLACEGCGAHLSFATPPTAWSRTGNKSDSPAEIFAEQLESGHKSLCAWKGNSCSETLALFLPSPPSALVGGFHDRCEALLQLSALPVISGSAMDTFKLFRGPQIESLLAQHTPPMGRGFQYVGEGRVTCAESGERSENGYSYEGFYQAQRLIALCGWEPRPLPYSVDCLEGVPPPSTVSQLGERCDTVVARKSRDPGPSVLLVSKGDKGEETNMEPGKKETNAAVLDPASAVLDCGLCKASVGLWSFSTIRRPPTSLITATEAGASEPLPPSKAHVQICGGSGDSGADDSKRKGQSTKDAVEDDAMATPVRAVRSSPPGVLNLNLTIAGGPPPTQMGSPAMIPPAFGPIPGFLQRFGQAEGSEVGDFVTSHESRGSRDHDNGAQVGGSTVGTMNDRNVPGDSTAEGTVVDRDVDDGDIGKGAGSLNRMRGAENSAVDQQVSHGAALTSGNPTSGNPNATTEMDTEVRHGHRKRRRTTEAGPSAHVTRHGQDLLPCSSSVNAIDTHYVQKQENSMESVENRFQDSDGPETALSAENHVIDQVEGTETVGQAVQSVDREAGSGRSVLQVEPGLSKSDEVECDDDGVETNLAVISTGTGAAVGASVMGGGSAGTQASHEIEMQGEVNGAEFSVHRPDMTAGDAEFIPEGTEYQGLMGEFVPDRGLMGESIPEDEQKAGPSDARGDSDEVMLQRSGKRRRLVKNKGTIESDSGKSRGKRIHEDGDDQTVDTTKAVIMFDGAQQKEATDGHTATAAEGEEEQHGCTTVNGPRRGLEEFRMWDTETGEFDPIRQHRHFCPWVNGHVAAAENSGSSQGGVCGWQLTVDALYTLDQQGSKTPQLAKSESTVSVYKAKSLVSGRRLSGNSPSQTAGGRRTLF